jgi:hypothetical protein
MASANAAIEHAFRFSIRTNRTFVELMAGSRAVNWKETVVTGQYHQSCPGSAQQIQYQRYGALYDLNVIRAAGVDIADADEFWRLRECGLLPKESAYMPHSNANAEHGKCFQCNDNNQTFMDFITSERIGARNQVMCPYHEDLEQWYAFALTDAPVVETCCIRKEVLGRIKVPETLPELKDWKLRLVFSAPRSFADRFMAKHDLTSGAGYIGLQWRAEKMVREWKHYDVFVAKIHERVDAEIAKFTVNGIKPKIYFACDFVKGGSMSYRPSSRAVANLMKVVDEMKARHGVLISFSPEEDLPEAIISNNFMLIAATETLILARAQSFTPLVPSGRFQGMIKAEHHSHNLDGGQAAQSAAPIVAMAAGEVAKLLTQQQHSEAGTAEFGRCVSKHPGFKGFKCGDESKICWGDPGGINTCEKLVDLGLKGANACHCPPLA